MNDTCQADCHPHTGKVESYHVLDPAYGKDWGLFDYCESAAERDRESGFIVTKQDQDGEK